MIYVVLLFATVFYGRYLDVLSRDGATLIEDNPECASVPAPAATDGLVLSVDSDGCEPSKSRQQIMMKIMMMVIVINIVMIIMMMIMMMIMIAIMLIVIVIIVIIVIVMAAFICIMILIVIMI